MILSLLTFLIAAAMTLCLVPLFSRYAESVGLVDRPDDNRKLHTSVIPMVGGVSIFYAVLAAVPLAFWLRGFFPLDWYNSLPVMTDQAEILGLVLAGSFLLLVGLVDDCYGIRGRQKLLGQIVAIMILVSFGFRFHGTELLGYQIDFGVFAVIIVFAWMLAAINSVNLLDGADGFASTIGIVISLALGAMSWHGGRFFDASIAFGMAGALIGFLRYNFPPAKVFLGDSGSMLIGFVLAALAIRCSFKQATAYAFFAPIALLAIPFIDTAAAIVRRRLTGRSIYSVDRGHMHHTMAKRGFGPRLSLLWVATMCLTTAAGAVLAVIYEESEYAIISIIIVVGVMFVTRIFGMAELQLVSKRMADAGLTFLASRSKNGKQVQQSMLQLQGNRDWRRVWACLCEFSDMHEIDQLTFDLNLPWIHESFHATRKKQSARRGENQQWQAEVPVIGAGKIFGRIEVVAGKDSRFTCQDIIVNLLKLMEELEDQLVDIASDRPFRQTSDASKMHYPSAERQLLRQSSEISAKSLPAK
ncbi:MAG: undecaprenyl/decaprenyl-phosphate alpha-N-acetylglucosaminyl 1-phosphate transferase [Mariniblastus sp.]|nr:undecaprenyl/decaprenyl-phosphate alpha-N-acetylglucosaminyl 1-phosphate transferase [Mariniblastus sp.]